MPHVAVALAVLSGISLLASLFIRRWFTIFFITAVFAAGNSYIAAPLNWRSLWSGHEFRLEPITPVTPPVPLEKLALPTDSPQEIIQKMGCYVCHRIPTVKESRFSSYCPVLIPGTLASLRITSPEYLARVKAGAAGAKSAREYIRESILHPDAFIVPGYERADGSDRSPMYPFYAKRFTKGALDVLVDYLMTIDVDAAVREGMIVGH
jgi:hypothetical protein